MKLSSTPIVGLPRLAWLALVDRRREVTHVLCGSDVERGTRHLVEGTWDGPFSALNFWKSQNFFGSGLALEDESIVFAPSRGLIDRLLVGHLEGQYVVSNSLPLLMRSIDARPAGGEDYRATTFTILEGIHEYVPTIPIEADLPWTVEQRYFFPFRIGAGGIEVLEDENTGPELGSFERYASYLDQTLRAIAENASDPQRRHPMTFRVAVSRGYDSPAAAALIARHRTPVAYTSRRSNSALPSWLAHSATRDDGSPIATVLGLPVRDLGPAPVSFDGRLFFAGGTGDPELVFAAMAEDVARQAEPSVVVSGYHGDKVWSLDPGEAYLGSSIRRGDTSGLALTEVRLSAGWVNLPVPFIGARRVREIVEVARSPAMQPWRVGGEYDRPIPRRIAEEAGIPRDAFGERKRAVVQTVVAPRDEALARDFGAWLKATEGRSLTNHRLLAAASLLRWVVLRFAQKGLSALGLRVKEPNRWAWLPGGDPTSLLFRWALSRLSSDDGPYPPELRTLVAAQLESSSS